MLSRCSLSLLAPFRRFRFQSNRFLSIAAPASNKSSNLDLLAQGSLTVVIFLLYPVAFLWSLISYFSRRSHGIYFPAVVMVVISSLWIYLLWAVDPQYVEAPIIGTYLAFLGGVSLLFARPRELRRLKHW